MEESHPRYYDEDPETVLGEAGLEKLAQLSDFSYSFEKIIKILVDRVEGLNEKMDRLAAHTHTSIKEVHDKIDTLAHNIQGFDSNAEQLEQEQKDLEVYREQLMKKTKEIKLKSAAKMKHVAARASQRLKKRRSADNKHEAKRLQGETAPNPQKQDAVESKREKEEQDKGESASPVKEIQRRVEEVDAKKTNSEKSLSDNHHSDHLKIDEQPHNPGADNIDGSSKIDSVAGLNAPKLRESEENTDEESEELPSSLYRSDGQPRNPEAMKRWKWARHQIKFKLMMKRLKMTDVKVKMSDSLSHRLEKTEEVLDNLVFRLGGIMEGSRESAGIRDELRVLNRRYEGVREQVETLEDEQKDVTLWRDNHDVRTNALEVITNETRGKVGEMETVKAEAALAEHRKDGALVDVIAKLRDLCLDVGVALTMPRVKQSPMCAYLKEFGAELMGDSHPLTEEHGPEYGSGLHDAETTREGPRDTARAAALERVTWALHRLLTLNQKGIDRGVEDFEYGRNFMQLKGIQKRGGGYGVAEGLRECYEACVRLLEDCVNPGAVKMQCNWLERELRELPTSGGAAAGGATAMLLEFNDRVEVVAELAEEALRMATESVSHDEFAAFQDTGAKPSMRRESSARATMLLQQNAIAAERSSRAAEKGKDKDIFF